MMPQWTSDNKVPLSEFQLKGIRKSKSNFKQPHYVGSQNHDQVAAYLQKSYKS
jgi:hypothetical protein